MNNSVETLKLSDLQVGQSAQVIGFYEGNRAYRQKLLSMGLTPGISLKIQRVAPLGDPMEVKLRGYSLSLRKKECECIAVELMES